MEDTKAPEGNVTPEEQAIYDSVMLAARTNILGTKEDPTRFKMVLQRLRQSGSDVAESIGGIAAVTLLNIKGAAEKQQREIPGDILFAAGDEVVDDLLEIAQQAGLVPKDKADQTKKLAMFAGLKMYGEHEKKAGGPDKRALYEQELKQLRGAAEGGKAPPAAARPAPGGIVNRMRAEA